MKKKSKVNKEVIIDIQNNNKAELVGAQPILYELYNAFSVRHPNAFHLRKYMPKGWDGKQHYISESGKFNVGLTQRVCDKIVELGYKYVIADQRKELDKEVKNITKHKGWKGRDYQIGAVQALTQNKIGDIMMPRGAIKVATNGGKTTISTFIYLSYKQPTVFLMNSKELFDQALVEIPEIIKEEVGYVHSKGIKYGRFMICMVATLKNRLKTDRELKNFMLGVKVLIVDEGDLADNKTNKEVIQLLHNTYVRVALSGTIFASKLAKDKLKNMNLEGFFGPLLKEVTNRELIDKGVSSEVKVRMVKGNTVPTTDSRGKPTMSWKDEYIEYLVNNKARNRRILKRSIKHAKRGRTNQLIVVQQHAHIENLLKVYQRAQKKGELSKDLVIDWVHHDRKDRAEVVRRFKDGEVDILIGSMILKRGKNFPKMQFMLNAGGGKGIENVLQLLGRAFRGAKFYEDVWDEGFYLKKHSRRRKTYYKNEKIEVINKYR